MRLSAAHRRFLLVDQGAVPALFNLVLNGAIAWLLFRTASEIPLWGESSAGVDLLATGFLLPFLTCLIVSPLVLRQVRAGTLPALPANALPVAGWSGRSPLVRGVALGAAGVALAATPTVFGLALLGPQPLEPWPFIGFKALWAALLAAAVTPLIGWWALAQASRGRAA